MTRRLLRVVLAWLLAVALPLQGYAVHAMSACGPAHGAVRTPATAELHGHHDEAPASLAGGGHDHAAMGHHATVDEGTAQPADDHHGPAGKCAACASCCNAVAITTSVVQTEIVRSLPVYVATVPIAHTRVLTGGLDRPPRARLA